MNLENIFNEKAKGMTALHYAAQKSNPEVLKALLGKVAKTEEPLSGLGELRENRSPPAPASRSWQLVSFKKARGQR